MNEVLVDPNVPPRSTAFELQVGVQPGMFFYDKGWRFRCYLCHKDFREVEQLGPGAYCSVNGWVPVCKTCIDAHNAEAKEST